MNNNFSKENELLINAHITMAKFLGQVLTTDYEIVIHKIDGEEISIAWLEHSEVSGRTLNSPITNYALSLINSDEYLKNDYLTNYKGSVKNKILKSSTLFIKNSNNDLVGLFCINYDPSIKNNIIDKTINNLKEQLNLINNVDKNSKESLNNTNHNHELIDQPIEKLNLDVEELIEELISKCLNAINLPINRLTAEEKMKIIEDLDKNNIFKVKGAVNAVAKHLQISVATTYRYIKKVK
ncbi:helix-turn-helix transcriptional regulator [Maledivibacter halophilus]|uniref:Predicted transcriptional regulator YheO, contains PAS and DNA-binding HTH domains n=1 Tax=Maledivibacter halophilus TaxID=36842 RepID=A0A1T5IUG9_9FIRM|nr:PAS domain-containing protein [Maledivibacter halophilus]SKC42810.1 Predicted transcriptional regulator YheO, contains PAS and DNA-binding HTH domains [Maledivibacter halophilus]